MLRVFVLLGRRVRQFVLPVLGKELLKQFQIGFRVVGVRWQRPGQCNVLHLFHEARSLPPASYSRASKYVSLTQSIEFIYRRSHLRKRCKTVACLYWPGAALARSTTGRSRHRRPSLDSRTSMPRRRQSKGFLSTASSSSTRGLSRLA